MQLTTKQLFVFSLGVFLSTFPSTLVRAQSSVSARVDTYSDQSIQVVSPAARGSVSLGEQTIEAGFGVDIVSGATMVLESDLISSATTFEETRRELSLTASTEAIDDWILGGGYTASIESDYKTHSFGVLAEVELLQAMSNLSLSANLSIESMGRTDEPESFEKILAPSFDVIWTQILDTKTSLQALASLTNSFCGQGYGCQANPYRFVAIERAGAPALALRERHPDVRHRGAAAVKASRAIGDFSAFHLTYRYYLDSWRVRGHTAEVNFATSLLSERLFLRADVRGALQGAAVFFDSSHMNSTGEPFPAYRSADEELSGMTSALIGGEAEWSFHSWGPFLRLALGFRGFHAWYAYKFHARQRRAVVLGSNLVAEF